SGPVGREDSNAAGSGSLGSPAVTGSPGDSAGAGVSSAPGSGDSAEAPCASAEAPPVAPGAPAEAPPVAPGAPAEAPTAASAWAAATIPPAMVHPARPADPPVVIAYAGPMSTLSRQVAIPEAST